MKKSYKPAHSMMNVAGIIHSSGAEQVSDIGSRRHAHQHAIPEGSLKRPTFAFAPSIAVEPTHVEPDTPDLTTVDVERETAGGAVSDMETISGAVQKATSTIDDAGNSINLMDSFSSTRKSLEIFNPIVEKLATVQCHAMQYYKGIWTHQTGRSTLTRKRGPFSVLSPRFAYRILLRCQILIF